MKKSWIYYIVLFVFSLLFTVKLYWITHSLTIVFACLVFSLFVFMLFYGYTLSQRAMMKKTVLLLSNMIESISDYNENEWVPITSDDLISKFQSQILKLINTLKSQNHKSQLESDNIKTLISDLSHQLKTPLSNLKLYYELLQDEHLTTEERDNFTKTFSNQIDKLNFLMESLIKMSRLEGDLIHLKKQSTCLETICLSAIKHIYLQAKNKNVSVEFTSHEKIKLSIDPQWTTEAIFNILDNAVKYSNENSVIEVSISVYEVYARIDIKDEGCGIPDVEVNDVFKRFYRGSSSMGQEGIGLGLYLAREIISRQSGYILLKSSPNNGTLFSVFFPKN